MTSIALTHAASSEFPELTAPVRIEVRGLRVEIERARGRRQTLLSDLSFVMEPGELVAIVGGSGAGKTTLLNCLAGVRPVGPGMVRYNGGDLAANLTNYRTLFGYVPQDDIVHRELTVERTLHYAARMRLAGMEPYDRKERVERAMAVLGLASHATQKVSSLSGGQRKRTSIGAELLTDPGVFFLDEPTSGLDPATGQDMMHQLKQLTQRGSTVVVTTHAPSDIATCDRVVFLARGGHLAFTGTPGEALRYFEAPSFEAIYARLVGEESPAAWSSKFRASEHFREPAPLAGQPTPRARRRTGLVHQSVVLTQRNFEILMRNRLTLAILAGAPAMVIAMFAILFRPGAFDLADPSPQAAVMILFWVAFGGFFFGLTYGLLQICTEFSIYHRERLVNLRVGPYVLSKMAVLVPLMVVVVVLMVAVLRALNRLPSDSFVDVYIPVTITLLLDGLAAIALGLFASAAVSRPEQATLVLPMLCFPQVLFSGAILPVPLMAPVGKVISYAMSDRWAFDALGKSIDLNRLFAEGTSPLGPPLLAQYEDTFSGGLAVDWFVMAGMTVFFLAATCVVLARKRTSFSV
ncbi:MAG: ATP-binding cassette domain-containing protein [Dehalococcoidia bacterium]